MARVPCRTCPWRVDQHADEIPCYDHELAEGLVSTTSGEFGAPIFACHHSRDGAEVVCTGWLWAHGWDSIAIRLQLAVGEMTRADLVPDPAIDRHHTFAEMIEKLRADCTTDTPYNGDTPNLGAPDGKTPRGGR